MVLFAYLQIMVGLGHLRVPWHLRYTNNYSSSLHSYKSFHTWCPHIISTRQRLHHTILVTYICNKQSTKLITIVRCNKLPLNAKLLRATHTTQNKTLIPRLFDKAYMKYKYWMAVNYENPPTHCIESTHIALEQIICLDIVEH